MSLAVSHEGDIPIGGWIGNGNYSDQETNRFQLTHLRKYISSLKDNAFVGDCKLFDAKRLGICVENGVRFITLVPESSSFRKKMIKKVVTEGKMELLKEEKGRKKGENIT